MYVRVSPTVSLSVRVVASLRPRLSIMHPACHERIVLRRAHLNGRAKEFPERVQLRGASTNDREFPRSAVRSLKAGNDVDRKEEKTGTALMDGGGGLIQRVRRQRSDTPETDHARI